MRRAVAYLRVSSERQAGNTSIPDQAAMLRGYAAARGIEIVQTFEDDGRSARVGEGITESFDRRPGWCSLAVYLRENPARRGGPDLVLVKDYKRFSRDVVAAQATIKQLRTAGVEVQAIEQPIDWTVPEQKILLGLYLADGEVDNDRRSASTRRGMVARLRDGVFIHHPPIGYRSVHAGGKRLGIEPDPETASLVVAAFALAADPNQPVDAGRQMLVKTFGAHRVRSKTRWAETLANRVYAGEVHVPEADGQPSHWVAGRHARLVPADVWARVQERLAGKAPGSGRRVGIPPALPLRGLVLCPSFHPHAGRILTGSGPQSKTRAQHWYYHTLGKGAYRVRAELVHTALRSYLVRITPTPEFLALLRSVIEEVVERQTGTEAAVSALARRDVASAEAKLLNAAEAAADGRIDAEGYAQLAGKYRTLRDDALARMSRKVEAVTIDRNVLTDALSVVGNLAGAWDAADVPGRRQLASSIMPSGISLNLKGQLNSPPSPLVSLITGDSDLFQHKAKGAASEETAPFGFGDPDET